MGTGTQCTSRVAVWLQQLTQCTSGSGAVHEENKRENPQQVVHSFVQVALGEQCEDGRRVREVDKDGRSVRGVKHIRLRRGAPARKSSRPSKSADREGCARSAESESESESERLHSRHPNLHWGRKRRGNAPSCLVSNHSHSHCRAAPRPRASTPPPLTASRRAPRRRCPPATGRRRAG